LLSNIWNLTPKTYYLLPLLTAAPKNGELILIDGQQRTTFFFLLLNYLNADCKFKIKYEIRKESDEFLQSIVKAARQSRDTLVKLAEKNEAEKHQDIYYFKKTIRIQQEVLNKLSKEILAGNVKEGERVTVDCFDNKLVFRPAE